LKRIIKKKRSKVPKDEKYGVSSYWMTFRKQQHTVNCKSKHQLALCGKISVDEFMDLP